MSDVDHPSAPRNRAGLRVDNLIAFGFPFSPIKASPFTRLDNGPGVVRSHLDELNARMTLVSRSAKYYVPDERVHPLQWDLTVDQETGSASSRAALGADTYNAIAPYESLLLEMMGRRLSQVQKDVESSGFQVLERRRMELRNRVAHWARLMEERALTGYINSNCPHLVDDLIVYLLAKGKGMPAVFPYRLPIVPGVSARLYLPAGLFEHHAVHGADGRLIRPEEIPESEASAPLPADLEDIHREVVQGGKTLGELSALRLNERGIARPGQWARPFIDSRVRGPWGWLAARVGPYRRKARLMRSLLATERSNRRQLGELTRRAKLPENFIYFPLHMQPEASTNPLGGFFSEQLRAVRLLAEALPAGWRLAVKEHPHQQLAARPEGWYDAVARTPGVTLVPMDWDSFALQRESRAVATVTGAAAWEAWLTGKPAIVFGHILYQSAPAIFPVRTRLEAHDALRAIRRGRAPSPAEIRSYLGRLAHLSFPGHLDAYINPCLPPEQLDPAENDREIGRRLARALEYQAGSSAVFAEDSVHPEQMG
nr:MULTISPECIES: hypothetical protein [unclassified Thioalkalivibrio]